MKFIFAPVFLSLFCIFSVAAQNVYTKDYTFFVEETPATFEGGMDNFYTIVSKNLRSVDDKVGRVYIQFLIDTTGKMSEFKILKGLSEKSNTEVLRLMKWIDEKYRWKPRLVRRQKVKTRMNIPIVFGEENTIAQKKKEFKITVTEDIPIKKDLFAKDRDTSEIVMSACFNQGIQIEYIEIERDTNNQEYLIYNMVENPPIFEGGMDNFYKIVQKNFKLAEKPKEIGSRVFIEFVIDTTGKMTDFKILKSISEENSKETLRVMNVINENYSWKPMIDIKTKKKYKMRFAIPIIFTLDKKKK